MRSFPPCLPSNLAFVCGLILIFFPTPPFADARTLYVSKAGDGSTGESWETAYTSIAGALASSASGDSIWVQGGLYNESLELEPGVGLFGGFAGTEGESEFDLRDWEAHPTVIDASGTGNRVLEGADGVVVDGFTITGGRASSGAGLHCADASMEIRNCVFTGNRSERESVVYLEEVRVEGGAIS